MRSLPRLACGLLLSVVIALLVARVTATEQARSEGPRIDVLFSREARAETVTGMVYVAISRDNRRSPIDQTSPTGVPLFSRFVDGLAPDAVATFTAEDRGHPLRSLRDLPAGEYWMQPFVNVYTRFPRADGHTVWLHNDQWEGQDWKRSPGNLFGDPVRVAFDPKSATPLRLVANKVIPPIPLPADTDMVKRIRFQSAILSKWWGQPIYLGATVLLPRGYDTHPNVRYPVNYMQDHFSLNPPGGFGRGGDFDRFWMSDTAPRFIAVTLQHPSPYYDDSYGVDSANNGPYGEAIIKELIPAVEQKFRVIRQPWARMLSGGSTGGWIALAHQVLYPDFYGGSFALCPDSVDFSYHQIVNIYSDANAYYVEKGWTKVERPSQRTIDGNIEVMMKDENWYELVVGDKSRSGGQWDIWEATYSPVGPDGYPRRLWNKETGVIDKSVAEQWKKYDMADILRKNWTVLGPKIADKIHVYVGDMDSYYLNDAVEKLNEFLTKTEDPKFAGEVVFQRRAPHCWGPRNAELWQKLAAQVDKGAPAGAAKSWKY
ncbi:MAG TPA: alpha/beta hydrolase-fold protein [Vicinamibacterales bacterium]|nr:alpha/beta hydrolase-fold protein [Vicinamibacterales bacterium]